MDNEEVFHKLVAIIREILSDSTTQISLDTSASDFKNWDSINHINILVTTEEAFGVKFVLPKLRNSKTLAISLPCSRRKCCDTPDVAATCRRPIGQS